MTQIKTHQYLIILLSETFTSTFPYDDDVTLTSEDISECIKIAALITLKLLLGLNEFFLERLNKNGIRHCLTLVLRQQKSLCTFQSLIETLFTLIAYIP